MADSVRDRKLFREMQQQARALIARTLALIREVETTLTAKMQLLRKFPEIKVFEMKDNLRKTRKMLGTLDRRHQLTSSSLFLKHADEKLLNKLARANLKLGADVYKLVVKLKKQSDEFQAYAQKLMTEAKQKKTRGRSDG